MIPINSGQVYLDATFVPVTFLVLYYFPLPRKFHHELKYFLMFYFENFHNR